MQDQQAWESQQKPFTAYELKMMKRLQKANQRAEKEAAVKKASQQTGGTKPRSGKLPADDGGDGPDHDRLLDLARDARQRGEMFYYLPEASDLKGLGKKVDTKWKAEEQSNQKFKEENEADPQQGMLNFFEQLEELSVAECNTKLQDQAKKDEHTSADQPVLRSDRREDEVVVEDRQVDDQQGSGQPALAVSTKFTGPNDKISLP